MFGEHFCYYHGKLWTTTKHLGKSKNNTAKLHGLFENPEIHAPFIRLLDKIPHSIFRESCALFDSAIDATCDDPQV